MNPASFNTHHTSMIPTVLAHVGMQNHAGFLSSFPSRRSGSAVSTHMRLSLILTRLQALADFEAQVE